MKSYKPTSPARRQATVASYKEVVTTNKPKKSLTKGFRRGSGRNNTGRITTRHKGGGVKRTYRLVDFKLNKKNIPARVETIEYDPNRSSYIALVCYRDGERRYVIAPHQVKVGDTFLISEEAPIRSGNRLPLSKIPIGTFVYNIEIKPGEGAKMVRSAGTYAEVIARDGGSVNLKMPSGEIRKINEGSWASIGEVSNSEHKLVVVGKAGRSRHMGIRPTVRGTAMNPVDHPMGGGEGRSRGQRPTRKSPWGKAINPGMKTRTPKKYSNYAVVSRRKNKRRK